MRVSECVQFFSILCCSHSTTHPGGGASYSKQLVLKPIPYVERTPQHIVHRRADVLLIVTVKWKLKCTACKSVCISERTSTYGYYARERDKYMEHRYSAYIKPFLLADSHPIATICHVIIMFPFQCVDGAFYLFLFSSFTSTDTFLVALCLCLPWPSRTFQFRIVIVETPIGFEKVEFVYAWFRFGLYDGEKIMLIAFVCFRCLGSIIVPCVVLRNEPDILKYYASVRLFWANNNFEVILG